MPEVVVDVIGSVAVAASVVLAVDSVALLAEVPGASVVAESAESEPCG
ncbi:hypothetical protein [Nannocystis pusilla]|uniref:Uncharacterized protein n=1 Tax=Nannocystis pusilla TaxID=889268 RepID=A0ABS7TS41_9BACT|nr:hypothetical protein [Nannocystis pusilla]MBZ5711053.1 hypothetical protein [Nannocystis pusilla]